MNGIFIALILGAVLTAAFSGTMPEVSQAGIESAKQAVQIAIGLLGMMALWLGFMRVLQDAGVMHSIARGLAPVMRRLFPDVPVEHPAMGAMIMNMAANILGLGNAATPFGLKAMQELDKLNPHKGVATNSMVLFLAINTSGVAVLPLGVVAIRASLGAENAAGIVVPTILATLCSTVVGVLIAKSLQGRARFAPERHAAATEPASPKATSSLADGMPKTESVADQAKRFFPSQPARWIVYGGGARNPVLLETLRERLGPAPVELSAAYGVPIDALEAIAFAVLGWCASRGEPGNLPGATGARHPAILGTATPPGSPLRNPG